MSYVRQVRVTASQTMMIMQSVCVHKNSLTNNRTILLMAEKFAQQLALLANTVAVVTAVPPSPSMPSLNVMCIITLSVALIAFGVQLAVTLLRPKRFANWVILIGLILDVGAGIVLCLSVWLYMSHNWLRYILAIALAGFGFVIGFCEWMLECWESCYEKKKPPKLPPTGIADTPVISEPVP